MNPRLRGGDLLAYLDPLQAIDDNDGTPHVGATKVMHRTDLRQHSLPLVLSETEPAR